MLTTLTIRRFKRFEDVAIELGNPVVFVGPNDSGKTSALQALALWHLGLKRWQERRKGKEAPEKRPGVTINRRDMVSLPVPEARLLWRNLHTRVIDRSNGGQQTSNVRVEIEVEGVTAGVAWTCGLEFDYANPESFYCRPLRTDDGTPSAVPDAAYETQVAYLPPMSGLAANETRLDEGAINVRLGEGRTAEVLRNLCYQLATSSADREAWPTLVAQMRRLFGVQLEQPEYIAERGEVAMTYRTRGGVELDLSCSGRGMQQTLLLLSYLALNRGAVVLLDEPDAHLEILRQREIYQVLSDAARRYESQVIVASHSEVLLEEAADRDVVIAFLGRPHRVNDRGSQVLKALKRIGADQYYQAEQKGWVLYLEGSTDLDILRALAGKLDHPARKVLEQPFVHYVANQPQKARDHFHGLAEAKPDFTGLALFDAGVAAARSHGPLVECSWQRCEIENYICTREVLLRWAVNEAGGPDSVLAPNSRTTMALVIDRLTESLAELDKPSPWSAELKVSDEFLAPLFRRFYQEVGSENLMLKRSYHSLAEFIEPAEIDQEVGFVLDQILAVSQRAVPSDDTGA